MKYIAIDIGSSFIKSALLDLDTCRIAAERKLPSPPRLDNANPNIFEVPALLYVDIVRELVDGYTGRFDKVAGILLATQMHGFVYSVPGRADLYTSWQDLRCLEPMPGSGVSYMEHLQRLFPPDEMLRAGVYIKPSLGLCNLYAWLDRDRTLPRDGTLFTIGSYVISRLAGNNICHLTNAAPLGLADVVEGDWNRPVLEKAGLGGIKLPDMAGDDFQVCGSLVSNGRELPVYPDFGDQQIAILGCLVGRDDAVVNIATGCQVSMRSDVFRPGAYEVRPYFENRYVNTISNMPGGRGLDVLIHFLRRAASAITGVTPAPADVWKAVHDGFVPDSGGLAVDMTFYPVPGNMNGGGITGITPANLGLSTLFSAAFENMAATYWRNILTLRPDGDVARLVCSGGVSWKNPHLVEAVRKTSGKPCVTSPIPDECLSGFFRAALVVSGASKNLDDRPDCNLLLA